jgi:hypothetical protein
MFAQLGPLNVYFEVRVSFLLALGFLSSSVRPQDEDDDTEVDDDDVEEDDLGWSLPAAVVAAAADTSEAATLETGSKMYIVVFVRAEAVSDASLAADDPSLFTVL